MSKKTQPVHVPREAVATAKAYAEKHGTTIGEAVARLIECAMKRKSALAKYERRRRTQTQPA